MKMFENQEVRGLSLWAGKAAPRYTSYPPATAFHDGVGSGEFVHALEIIPSQQPISLYIHIPFCRSLCLYCGCNTAVTNKESRLQRYVDGLKQEARSVRDHLGARRVSHLHFGGGTPNILPPTLMAELFDHLHSLFDFSAANDIAMELDPRIMTADGLRALVDSGVTRVSLGVQDFNPDVQAAIGREQPESLVAQVCDQLRSAGIKRINFDLIYGLPKQSEATMAETARKTCALGVDRVALFSYAHVPQFKTHQRALEAHGLPDLTQKLAMEQASRAIFVAHGYAEIGMDHFAQSGDSLTLAQQSQQLRRNFQGYTDDAAEVLIGLGASSISQLPEGYFQNCRDEQDYLASVTSARLATARGISLTSEDRLRRAVIEKLMCALACDLKQVCRDYGVETSFFDENLRALAPFHEAGLLTIHDNEVQVTATQRMAVRAICQIFDTHSAPHRIASRVA